MDLETYSHNIQIYDCKSGVQICINRVDKGEFISSTWSLDVVKLRCSYMLDLTRFQEGRFSLWFKIFKCQFIYSSEYPVEKNVNLIMVFQSMNTLVI